MFELCGTENGKDRRHASTSGGACAAEKLNRNLTIFANGNGQWAALGASAVESGPESGPGGGKAGKWTWQFAIENHMIMQQ